MIRFLRQMGIVLSSTVALLVLLDCLYTWVISESPLHGIGKNDKLDWVIAGDSRTQFIDPDYVSLISGKKIKTVADGGYEIENVKSAMEIIFSKGNRVDRVLLQVDNKFIGMVGTNRPLLTPYFIRMNGLFMPRVPFKFYASQNKDIPPAFVFTKAMDIFTDTGGETPIDTSDQPQTSTFKRLPERPFDFSKLRLRMEAIEDFKAFLENNGVRELVLYTPPYHPDYFSFISDTSTYKKKTRATSFEYHDLSDIYKDSIYFYDYVHISPQKNREYMRRVVSTIINR